MEVIFKLVECLQEISKSRPCGQKAPRSMMPAGTREAFLLPCRAWEQVLLPTNSSFPQTLAWGQNEAAFLSPGPGVT